MFLASVYLPILDISNKRNQTLYKFWYLASFTLRIFEVHLCWRMLKWFAFPSLVDHVLSELSTLTCLGWPYMAWFTVSLSLIHVISLVRNDPRKTLMLGKIESRRRGDRGWDGWVASLTQRTWIWANSRRDGQGRRQCGRPWGHKESETPRRLNNNL